MHQDCRNNPHTFKFEKRRMKRGYGHVSLAEDTICEYNSGR